MKGRLESRRIVLIEDDLELGEALAMALEDEGAAVEWQKDASRLLQGAVEGELMILDLGLPGVGGLEFLQSLRARGFNVPVLVLTARDALDDRLSGLEGGADDYMTKPFELDELIARLRALHRRATGRQAEGLSAHGVVLNASLRRAEVSGMAVNLSPAEFRILEVLFESAGQVVTRDVLMLTLCESDTLESNALEVHVHHLRKKLPEGFIETVRGIGYRVV